MKFQTVELFRASKSGEDRTNEDVVLDTTDWLVVCDGATDKSGYKFDGSTGGQLTAQLTAEVIVEHQSGTGVHTLVATINKAYNDFFGPYLEELSEDRPSCTFVAVDKKAATVFRVGDVSWSDGKAVFGGSKEIDNVHSQMRAVYLEMLLLEGRTQEDLLANDPARELILPSLRKQSILRNNTRSQGLSFGAVDGTPIPEEFMETWRLDDDVVDIIVATDGYPVLKPTLELSEWYLQMDLERDPLRIKNHASTKGVYMGQQSFDDRAYARLQRL